MNKYTIVFLSLLSPIFVYSQNKIENTYCNMLVSDSINFEPFKKINEEKGFIDSYKLLVNSKPICVLFLMFNKLEAQVNVGEENYKDYIFDIGELNVLKTEQEDTYLKIYYKDKKVQGIIYLESKNDILYRFVFMFPNEDYLLKYDKIADSMFSSIEYKKSTW